MIEAVRLALQYPDLQVIFSGGSGEFFPNGSQEPEAELARRFFDGFKIAPPRLRLEDRSRNTLENAVFTAELVKPQHDQRWVLVTSAFHMPRARALFEAQGFHIIPRPGDFRTFGPQDRWQIFGKPSDGLRRLDVAAKEWVGLWISWLRGDIAWPHELTIVPRSVPQAAVPEERPDLSARRHPRLIDSQLEEQLIRGQRDTHSSRASGHTPSDQSLRLRL